MQFKLPIIRSNAELKTFFTQYTDRAELYKYIWFIEFFYIYKKLLLEEIFSDSFKALCDQLCFIIDLVLFGSSDSDIISQMINFDTQQTFKLLQTLGMDNKWNKVSLYSDARQILKVNSGIVKLSPTKNFFGYNLMNEKITILDRLTANNNSKRFFIGLMLWIIFEK